MHGCMDASKIEGREGVILFFSMILLCDRRKRKRLAQEKAVKKTKYYYIRAERKDFVRYLLLLPPLMLAILDRF